MTSFAPGSGTGGVIPSISQLVDRVRDVDRLAEVEQVLIRIVDQVVTDRQTRELRDAEQKRQEMEELVKEKQNNWDQESAALSQTLEVFQARHQALTQELLVKQEKEASLAENITIFKRLETQHQSRKSRLHVKSDITCLPKLLLRSLMASYLTLPDLANSLATCYRWKETLDKGYVWKTMIARAANKRKKAEEAKRDNPFLFPEPPRSVQTSVLLDKKKGEAAAGVQDVFRIFELCDESVHRQLVMVCGERDEIVAQSRANQGVNKHVETALEEVRDELGRSLVDLWSWKNKLRRIAQDKINLAEDIAKGDDILNTHQTERASLKEAHDEQIKSLKEQVQLMSNAQAHLANFQTARERSASIQRSKETHSLRGKKKQLVNQIKTLRKDITKAKKEKEHWQQQLEAFKLKLRGI